MHRRLLAACAAGLLLAGCGASSSTSSKSTPTVAAKAPFALGSTDGEAVGKTVDGIKCETHEQVRYHIHSHLAVFVNGRPGQTPEGIGVAPPRQEEASVDGPFVLAGSCFYWLHSHTNDGVIHIESPDSRTYTLGNYFDIWNQPLSATRVGQAMGPVTAYVGGKPYTGDPRSIKLGLHAVIQLDVGMKVAPVAYTFPSGL